MNSSRVRRSGAETNIKLAGKPKLIPTIEKDVEAGVPRSNATIRNEQAFTAKKPSVPRSSALMGHEQNVPATLPDVAVDSSYMGTEKELQSGMPAINNEIKGTVIAQAQNLPTAPPETNSPYPTEGAEACQACGQGQVKGPHGNAVCGNQQCKNYNAPNNPLGNDPMGVGSSSKNQAVLASAEKMLMLEYHAVKPRLVTKAQITLMLL
jgi:hypothetical protein